MSAPARKLSALPEMSTTARTSGSSASSPKKTFSNSATTSGVSLLTGSPEIQGKDGNVVVGLRSRRDAMLACHPDSMCSEWKADHRVTTLSSTSAKPIPPAAQMETSPNWTSRRTISLAMVVMMRAPVAPNG